MASNGYVTQFKTIEDLDTVINSLIEEHRTAKQSKLGVMFRVVISPNDATTYVPGTEGNTTLVSGVRVCDYAFGTSTNLEWVIPHPYMGLSFSKTLGHLKRIRKLLSRHARGYKNPGPANVAWWILEERSLPDGMAFVEDPDDKNHYFLAVTKRMHITTLAKNLKLIAHKMTVMNDLTFGS